MRKKSARTRPSQEAASKASTASFWTSAVSSGVSGAGDDPRGRVDVLRLEVVVRVLLRRGDLGRDRRARAVLELQDTALDLAAPQGRLHEDLRVVALCLRDRLVKAGQVVDLGDADRRTRACGLHEQRPAVLAREVDDLLAGRGLVPLPLARPDHHVRADLEPEGGEHPLHVLLVLADGRGEHTRADVRHTGELQEALQGAVLAVGAVQDGEDDVDLAERLGHRSRLAVDDFTVGGVDGEHHAALARLGEFLDTRRTALGDRHAFRFVGGERPTAVPGDADRQDVVLGPVDGPQYGAAW